MLTGIACNFYRKYGGWNAGSIVEWLETFIRHRGTQLDFTKRRVIKIKRYMKQQRIVMCIFFFGNTDGQMIRLDTNVCDF